MNGNQLAPFDDDHRELDVASPDAPDGAGGPTGFAGELSGSTGGGRSINTTIVVLGIILLAAAGGIWSMRLVATASADDGPSQARLIVQKGITDLFEKESGDAEGSQSVFRLADDPTEKQVPLPDVQKNPFRIPGVDDDEPEVVDAAPVEVDPAEERRRRRAMIEQAAERIHVTSVLSGSSPVAIIEGMVVRTGDEVEIDDWRFTIVEIGGGGVTLELEDGFLREPVRVVRSMQIGGTSDAPRRPSNRRPRPRR